MTILKFFHLRRHTVKGLSTYIVVFLLFPSVSFKNQRLNENGCTEPYEQTMTLIMNFVYLIASPVHFEAFVCFLFYA